jgi:peptidoglycan hydrolase-like protein with peptidoglycan-binding domain
MNLQVRNLSVPLQGDDVTLLHRELAQLGYTIPTDETNIKLFGSITKQAVQHFQRTHGLSPDGVVDAVTARAIHAAVDAKAPERYTVSGAVRHQDGTPLKGVRVRAYDRELRDDEGNVLGETTSEDNGIYQIVYTAAQFRRAGKPRANLVVRAFSPEGLVIGETETIFHAPPTARVSVLVAPRPAARLSEYEQMLAEIRPLLEER